jgi:hypothetical protein
LSELVSVWKSQGQIATSFLINNDIHLFNFSLNFIFYIPLPRDSSLGGNMKFIALSLSFLISFNVMASSLSEFEKHFDEYHYTLTVEWDQRDQTFYQEQTDAFMKKLGVLITEHGLSQAEVLALAEKKMNNSKLLEALKLKMTLMGTNMSAAQLAQTLRETAKEFYLSGASWNGDVMITSAIVGLFVLAIGYAIWFSATHECVEYKSVYSCDTTSYCAGYEYDWQSGTSSCYRYEEETSCGYEDQCSQWQKKK